MTSTLSPASILPVTLSRNVSRLLELERSFLKPCCESKINSLTVHDSEPFLLWWLLQKVYIFHWWGSLVCSFQLYSCFLFCINYWTNISALPICRHWAFIQAFPKQQIQWICNVVFELQQKSQRQVIVTSCFIDSQFRQCIAHILNCEIYNRQVTVTRFSSHKNWSWNSRDIFRGKYTETKYSLNAVNVSFWCQHFTVIMLHWTNLDFSRIFASCNVSLFIMDSPGGHRPVSYISRKPLSSWC